MYIIFVIKFVRNVEYTVCTWSWPDTIGTGLCDRCL